MGVVNYAYGEYSILPRSENDIVFTGGGSEISVSYSTGWNLVGVSMFLDSYIYTDVYADGIEGTMYGFDNTYYSASEIIPGEGYWLYFNNNGNQVIEGQPINSQVVSLLSGWNLISGPSTSFNINNAMDPNGIIIQGTLYGFNETYVPTDELQPGYGYWLNANNDGEITLTNTHRSEAPKFIHNELTNASILNINGMPLYFGVEISDDKLNRYSLPPLPPETWDNGHHKFTDVRFADHRKMMTSTGEILIRDSNNEVQISWSIHPDCSNQEWELINQNGMKIEMKGDGESSLNRKGSGFILRKVETVPESFTLDQNFPNPFNPSTTIEFGIPEASYVSLIVYDLNGLKVNELLKGEVLPGVHAVQWDGTNENGIKMSSGVYLYTLVSESFIEMKKMIFIK
jgi:hypothetical protein